MDNSSTPPTPHESISVDARRAIPAATLARHGVTLAALGADPAAADIMAAATAWGWATTADQRGYWGDVARTAHRTAAADGADTPAVQAAWDHFLAVEHAGLTGVYR